MGICGEAASGATAAEQGTSRRVGEAETREPISQRFRPAAGMDRKNPIRCSLSADQNSKGEAIKTALGAFTALLIARALYEQPAHAQVQVLPAPGFSVQIGPGAPPPPEPRRDEWREREGYYGSGSEERREERWREERSAANAVIGS